MKKKKIWIIVVSVLILIIGIIFIINRINSIKVIDEEGKIYYVNEGDKVNLLNCHLEIISIEDNQVIVKINGNLKTCDYNTEIPIYLNNESRGLYITNFAPMQSIVFEK